MKTLKQLQANGRCGRTQSGNEWGLARHRHSVDCDMNKMQFIAERPETAVSKYMSKMRL